MLTNYAVAVEAMSETAIESSDEQVMPSKSSKAKVSVGSGLGAAVEAVPQPEGVWCNV